MGAQGDSRSLVGFVEGAKTEDQSIGSTAWRLRAEQGARSRYEARGAYRAQTFKVEAAAQITEGVVRAQSQLEGSISWLAGPPTLANRIDGAFALVEVGAPGLPVLYRNQPVGVSDRRGRVLVRNLQAFDRNLIEIDTRSLPLDLDAPRTQVIASPLEGGGVIARFEVVSAQPSMLVRLIPVDGLELPAGSRASSLDGRLNFIVGYDGEVFISGMPAGGALTVDMGDGRGCVTDIPAMTLSRGVPRATPLSCR